MNHLACILSCLAVLGANAALGQQSSHQSRLNAHYTPHFRATLGIVVGPVSGPLAAHVPVFQGRPGYGLVVLHVAPDSAAARAGLTRNDILVSFGNQLLYSTHQYAELLERVQPGQKVKIQVVHPGSNGKVSTIDTTMGWAEQMHTNASIPKSFNPLGTAVGGGTAAASPQASMPTGGYVYPPARYRTPTRDSLYTDDPSRYEPQDYESLRSRFEQEQSTETGR